MTEQNGNRHPTDAQLLQKDSLALVEPVADQLIAQFYELLFAAHPEVRPDFPLPSWTRSGTNSSRRSSRSSRITNALRSSCPR